MIEPLRHFCEGKNVCFVGAKPPSHLTTGPNPDAIRYLQADKVVRCNEWWEPGERCNIWFSVGYFEKIKPEWFFRQEELTKQLDAFCFHASAGEANYRQLCEIHNVWCAKYDKDDRILAPIFKWFELRGGTPSTGMTAIYALSHCKPKSLHVTGMDLYSSNPDRKGWKQHNPIGQAIWLLKLSHDHEFLTLGNDVKRGIKYWSEQDEGDYPK